MDIPCPLCKCMLSIFSMVQRQLSKKCKGIQNKEKNTKTITYRRADGTYKNKHYDCDRP